MKFKGQGKINICGFEYKKNIADSRGGGGVRAPKKKPLYPRLLHRPSVHFGLGTVSKVPCGNALLPSGHNVTSKITGEAATIRQPEEHPGLLMAIWFPQKGSIPPQFPKCSVSPPPPRLVNSPLPLGAMWPPVENHWSRLSHLARVATVKLTAVAPSIQFACVVCKLHRASVGAVTSLLLRPFWFATWSVPSAAAMSSSPSASTSGRSDFCPIGM